MAMTEAQYADFMENTEQVITARNLEEYLVENPEAEYPPPPDPTYAELLVTGRAQMLDCLGEGNIQAAVLTTDSSGNATLEYPEMDDPVISATVVDATDDTTFYQVVIQSVTSTAAVVRVTQNTAVTLLGIPVLTIPAAANGASVHVSAVDAG